VLDPVPSVNVDRAQLLQAVLNLALNARDAMPEGGELGVHVTQGEPAPHYDFVSPGAPPENAVRIEVSDRGSGIAPEVLPHIFEPFFTTKEAGQGTGLGLAMVCAFVEANGGRLGVRSRPGEGATFSIELPAVEGRSATSETAVSVRLRSGATILVVDDDVRVRSVVASTLRDAGYVVVEVERGDEALARAAAGEGIDLLCTDALLPGLSGEALVRRFHAEHPSIPILVCSAYVDDPGLRAWIEANALPVVRKPFSRAELERAIAKALTGASNRLRDRVG
jgi:CheY-like chemotaxis protein